MLSIFFQMMRIFKLQLVGVMLFVIQAAMAIPNENDRNLQRELKKIYGKHDYVLLPLKVPEKFNPAGTFFQIKSSINDAQLPAYVYIGRVNIVRSAAATGKKSDNAEYFDYFILFNASKAVNLVRVTNYQSSYGEMISSPGWLRKFIGHAHPKPLEVGRQIDAISGATISVNNITFDIRQKSYILQELALN
jgi:hypothetical protein